MNILFKKLYNISLKFLGFIFETKIGHFCFLMLFGSMIIFLMSAIIDINPLQYIICIIMPATFFAMIDNNDNWI
jgi:hypothetical protein